MSATAKPRAPQPCFAGFNVATGKVIDHCPPRWSATVPAGSHFWEVGLGV